MTDDKTLIRRSLMKKAEADDPLFLLSDNDIPEKDDLRLEPTLYLTREGLQISLKIGENKLYVVRHIPQFLQQLKNGEKIYFGKGFEFDQNSMRFDDEQRNLLSILCEYIDIVSEEKTLIGVDARVIFLKPLTAVRVLHALKNLPFYLNISGKARYIDVILENDLPIISFLTGTVQALKCAISLPYPMLRLTPKFDYVLTDDGLHKVSDKQQALLNAIVPYVSGGESAFLYGGEDVARFFSEVMPVLSKCTTVSIADTIERNLVKHPLNTRVYLDKKDDIIEARVKFIYADYEIDPFESKSTNKVLLLRDNIKEGEVMQVLSKAGFHVTKGLVYLSKKDYIFEFVKNGVKQLTDIAEVYLSKSFKKLTPVKPNLTARVGTKNGYLTLELLDDGVEIEELEGIMRALREKKQYFRYKSGTFLDLSNEDEMMAFAEAYLDDYKMGEEGIDKIPLYKAAYLKSIIDEQNMQVTFSEEAEKASNFECEVKPPPIDNLRSYQVTGYEWLMTLDRLHMGGILADDMGLGKTIQTIAALYQAVKSQEKSMPSIIVAPTSLLFNWKNEIKKFAPFLRVMMIKGNQIARKDLIEQIEIDKPHVVLTSYPLIRRDIELYKKMQFHFAVLDEAQQIKNALSVGAHAVKQLNARTKVALTGTPMENHAGELWSIFDFCLPHYLPSYAEFLKKYSEGQNVEDLKKRIRPFLLRRLKEDVLKDLPERLEETMFVELTSEQKKVYDAVLLQSRQRVDEILNNKGMARGRAEVLAAITRLRQICCDPTLVMDRYIGNAAKEELLMDILPPALQSGKRALLFSQFTSMLKILKKSLEERDIEVLYLDGDTKPQERQELSDSFNKGKGQVFLISLKAGGTGLNLTGADMVIHYDPWWNNSAQEQATGRAHRIGQTKTVNVISLVTHGTIEEQVLQLSERKKQLFDKLITAGEGVQSSVTNEDILALLQNDL